MNCHLRLPGSIRKLTSSLPNTSGCDIIPSYLIPRTRLTLDGYFIFLVFWYQREHLLTSQDFFLQGIYIRLAIEYLPKCSMYWIFTNIYPKNHPNVGKYTIHGAYGIWNHQFQWLIHRCKMIQPGFLGRLKHEANWDEGRWTTTGASSHL